MPTPRVYYDLPQYRPFWARGRSGSTCRSICIRATRCRRDAKIYEGHPWLLGPDLGVRRRRPRCMRCG